jgi:hypothetical protein
MSIKRPIHAAGLLALTMSSGLALSQEYRSYSGWGNNLDNPSWGGADTHLTRFADAHYSDGVSAMAGADRPSARAVSNAFHHGRSPVWSARVLTSMVFNWGQFIDHDIGLSTAPGEAASIEVPLDDAWMTPGGAIPFTRSIWDPATGTDPSNPREQVNEISSYIDGSMVYGSDEATALALREGVGGRLLTGPGDLLPFNTLGVFMDDPFHRPAEQLFAAGDIRANEQPGLTCLHTLFVREHNRLAAEIAATHPGWTDEQIYQRARELNGAQIQAITYNEFLPALLGEGMMPAYAGYYGAMNAGIANEFSAACYRFGHTMVNPSLPRYSPDGSPFPGGDLDLFQSFFNPDAILSSGGIEPIMQGQIRELAQEIDPFIVDDLRNLLFGGGGVGLDLASLNIQRGRDHGLPSYNQMRVAMKLAPANTFADISPDPDIQARLASVYSSPDQVDLWVGALCEPHVPGGSVGPLLHAVLVKQFTRLRDGDRFFYLNHLSPGDINAINNTRLSDIIRRNTSIAYVQDNVFFVSADFTEDARVAFEDAVAFLLAFSNNNPRADLAPDGAFDVSDVLAFLTAFDRYYTP